MEVLGGLEPSGLPAGGELMQLAQGEGLLSCGLSTPASGRPELFFLLGVDQESSDTSPLASWCLEFL